MPVADVNSSVQCMVEQMKSGKKELGQSLENFLSKESAVLCGVNGENLLGVENYQLFRDSAHIYWTPTATLWDRTYQCLHAHGLAKELLAPTLTPPPDPSPNPSPSPSPSPDPGPGPRRGRACSRAS